MTYIADLDPNSPATARAEALAESFEIDFPAWEVAEGHGDRFIGERDLPLYDASADADRISDADWEAYAEQMYREWWE